MHVQNVIRRRASQLSPNMRHAKGVDSQLSTRTPTQRTTISSTNGKRKCRSGGLSGITSTQTPTRKHPPQAWVCSICTFLNTSSCGGVLLPWCAMCPDGRRFPAVAAHMAPGGRARSLASSGSKPSSKRRKPIRPIQSFFAPEKQPTHTIAHKPLSGSKLPPDHLIDKFVNVTTASREDAIKCLISSTNDIEAAINIYFRK